MINLLPESALEGGGGGGGGRQKLFFGRVGAREMKKKGEERRERGRERGRNYAPKKEKERYFQGLEREGICI